MRRVARFRPLVVRRDQQVPRDGSHTKAPVADKQTKSEGFYAGGDPYRSIVRSSKVRHPEQYDEFWDNDAVVTTRGFIHSITKPLRGTGLVDGCTKTRGQHAVDIHR